MDALAKKKYRKLIKLLNEKGSPLEDAFEKAELMNFLNDCIASDGSTTGDRSTGGEAVRKAPKGKESVKGKPGTQ